MMHVVHPLSRISNPQGYKITKICLSVYIPWKLRHFTILNIYVIDTKISKQTVYFSKDLGRFKNFVQWQIISYKTEIEQYLIRRHKNCRIFDDEWNSPFPVKPITTDPEWNESSVKHGNSRFLLTNPVELKPSIVWLIDGDFDAKGKSVLNCWPLVCFISSNLLFA